MTGYVDAWIRPLALAGALGSTMSASAAPPVAPTEYTIEAIGWAQSFSTDGAAISPTGVVTGQWCCDLRTPAGAYPFIYRDGKFRRSQGFVDRPSQGHAVNDYGVVVGLAQAGFEPTEAFFDDGTGPRLIGRGARDANGINATGMVVGSTDTGAFTYDITTGSYQPLPLPGLWAIGAAINDAGVVVGSYWLAGSDDTRGYRFAGGVSDELPTLGGRSSWARGLNSRGDVAGCASTADGRSHAVVWRAGTVVDLTPDLPAGAAGCARAINARGEVVGEIVPSGQATVAFLHANGRLRSIQSLLGPADAARWQISFASGINDRGEIVGSGMLDGEKNRAFVMRPKR